MLLMLDRLGLKLSLRLWSLAEPRVITIVIIKETPNRWWCGGPAVLLAAGPAGWIAAWLGPSGLRWSSSLLL
jgi:hypothetical protein